MMGIGNFVAAHLFYGLIKGAFSHFGAERAGIGLFPVLKKDMGDIRLHDLIGNFHLPAKLCHRSKITFLISQVHRNLSLIHI